MTAPRELIRALMKGTGRSEADVEAFLDEDQRVAKDIARRANEARARAREVHRQIRQGEMS